MDDKRGEQSSFLKFISYYTVLTCFSKIIVYDINQYNDLEFEKECLDLFADHYKTGEKIPEELVKKIKESASSRGLT